MPAKAGIQSSENCLDSRLRGNDEKRRFLTFYETVKVGIMEYWNLEKAFVLITHHSNIPPFQLRAKRSKVQLPGAV